MAHAEFTDVNLKLAVVQVLMYEQEALTPVFDLQEFVAGHTARQIDVDEEGYQPIPEVLQHFADLPVPTELLPLVTEIYMDGGNEIYLAIAPQWDGEDSAFDIASYDDLALLPELTSVTLMGADEATLDQIRARGIEADLL